MSDVQTGRAACSSGKIDRISASLNLQLDRSAGKVSDYPTAAKHADKICCCTHVGCFLFSDRGSSRICSIG